MADTGRHADHNWHMEAFAHVIGRSGHVFCFLRVRRFKHADFGKSGKIAVVLFILGRMHTRIVGRNKDKPAVDLHIGIGKKGIGGNVDADHLHGGKRAHPCNRFPDSGLHSHFFVRCPFGVDFCIRSCIFQDFCTRCTRIG